jgi:hypothetical protein
MHLKTRNLEASVADDVRRMSERDAYGEANRSAVGTVA